VALDRLAARARPRGPSVSRKPELAVKQLLLFLPVIHLGYERFLARHSDAAEVLLLGEGFKKVYPNLARDLRALPADRASEYVRKIAGFPTVHIVEPSTLIQKLTGQLLVMPDEEVTRDLVTVYQLQNGRQIAFDQTFLRWDKVWASAKAPISADTQVSTDALPREMLGLANSFSRRSSDWWRQVGAVAARDSEILTFAWNHHHPSEYAPYYNGDPRGEFERGVRTELATAIHAEAALVANAARSGISLAHADIYTTTFPCPACARLIVEAGFKRCYFEDQYSALDAEEVLRAAGIALIWVNTETSLKPTRADSRSV
jgi:dCMP deaminase